MLDYEQTAHIAITQAVRRTDKLIEARLGRQLLTRSRNQCAEAVIERLLWTPQYGFVTRIVDWH